MLFCLKTAPWPTTLTHTLSLNLKKRTVFPETQSPCMPLIFSVTHFHIYPEYVPEGATIENAPRGPLGGAKGAPKLFAYKKKFSERGVQSTPNVLKRLKNIS